MSCPGLHCPGCSSGQSLAVLGGVAAGVAVACETVRWAAEHAWEIGGTLAACFALSVAACMWLERWAVVRGARFAERHGIYSRAGTITPPAVATVTAQVIEHHHYLHAITPDPVPAVVRAAIPGKPEDAITDRRSPWKH